jgi:hypothetical protein
LIGLPEIQSQGSFGCPFVFIALENYANTNADALFPPRFAGFNDV